MINTQHCRDLLRKRYKEPEWVLLEEVAPKTGGGTRYADAIAVNLWKSRGHAIHGFEIKVSRTDWLRELKVPEKADSLCRYCDHWWIVAPNGVVKKDELPISWGLLEVCTAKVTQTVAAPRLTPDPITREFFASLMRRGHEAITVTAERIQRDATNRLYEQTAQKIEQGIARGTRKLKELEQRVFEFEKATGLKFSPYDIPPAREINLAMRLVELQSYGNDWPLSKLACLADQLTKASELVREAISQVGLEDAKFKSPIR